MPLWEYKVITSGRGGFATPALLEKFLNDLGREEWEIIQFHTLPDNPLAFTGMARRTTQRDWTLEDAAAAAARTEADKLRAEFEAKFKSASSAGAVAAADEKPQTIASEKLASDDGMRKFRDTTRDLDPDADDEEPKDEWDKIAAEDELPTFFDSLRPHMRRNQRGPGMSVGVEFLAKKWNLSDDDVKGALVECGFPIPEDEDDKPVYIEYEGDLYWLNINRRGELWLNTKEKPRPVFRTVQGTRVPDPVEDAAPPAASSADSKAAPESSVPVFKPSANREPDVREAAREAQPPRHQERRDQAPGGSPVPLPSGPALLEKIRPLMRRNRRGAGGSGSTTFLSRGLKCNEADLMAAFTSLGLTLGENSNDKPVNVEIGSEIWWLNKDSRGGVWINGREKEAGETLANPAPSANGGDTESGSSQPASGATTGELPLDSGSNSSDSPSSSDAHSPSPPTSSPSGAANVNTTDGAVLPSLRALLKETKTGSFSAKVDQLSQEIGKSVDDLVNALIGAGLKVPEKSREKPVFVDHAGEIFWLNKTAKDELWLNAKASKFADKEDGADGEKKNSRRPRGKKKSDGLPEEAQLPTE